MMALRSTKLPQGSKAFASTKVSARITSVSCHAGKEIGVDRRQTLLQGAALAASPLLLTLPAQAETVLLPIDGLSTFQRKDQLFDFRIMAEKILQEDLTGADAPIATRLVFNEATTFDMGSMTGGVDGSIVLSSESDRSENAALKDFVRRLALSKEKIDAIQAQRGSGPISWADLMVLAGKVSNQTVWREVKLARSSDPEKAKAIINSFRSAFDITLGRIDSTEAAPEGRVPAADAPVEEIVSFMSKLGAKSGSTPGPFSPKPPFWERPAFVMWAAAAADPAAEEDRLAAGNAQFAEYKSKYDKSRATVTRTEYEVDFAEYYEKLCMLGAKLDRNAYLYPLPIMKMKF